MSGGNYFIAVEQILSSLQLQRLKLFDRLSITTTHYHDPSLCCSQELTEEELLIVDDAVMTTEIFWIQKQRPYTIRVATLLLRKGCYT